MNVCTLKLMAPTKLHLLKLSLTVCQVLGSTILTANGTASNTRTGAFTPRKLCKLVLVHVLTTLAFQTGYSAKCHTTFNISFYFAYVVSFGKYIPLPESMKGEISSNRLINLDQNPIGKYGISYNRMMVSEFSQWGSSITGLWSDKLQKVETVRN